MTPDYPVLYLARVVLETTTPLSISSGIRDGTFDTLLVRDANGLPAIPGSSLAGVLRSLFRDMPGMPDCETVFGYADGSDGMPSRLQVSWGAIHDERDRPVEGLLLGEEGAKRLKADPVLSSVTGVSPLIRDHIRIHHRGAGDNKGKFDRTALHSGHRFSVEVSFWSKGEDCSEAARDWEIWRALLSLFSHPGFRLGGHTRRGLGAAKVVRMCDAHFNLSKVDDYRRYCALPRGLGETSGLEAIKIAPQVGGWLDCSLELQPEEGWRFGQGDVSLLQHDKEADLLPVAEPRVYWNGDRGELGPARVLIPASGIKGPLAHRVAYHYDCLTDNWSTVERCKLDQTPGEAARVNPAVIALFGYAKSKDAKQDDQAVAHEFNQSTLKELSTGQSRGRAGWLYFDDVYIDKGLNPRSEVHRQWHNGIDRFTGGVRKHVLYGEELVWRNTLKLKLRIDPRASNLDDNCRRALRLALEDICEGRLAIGGGSGKGHGYCRGTLRWSDDGRWIGGEQ